MRDPSYRAGQRLDVTYLGVDPTHLTYAGATDGLGVIVLFAGLVYSVEALCALALLGWLAQTAIRWVLAVVDTRRDAAYIRRARRLRQRRAAARR